MNVAGWTLVAGFVIFMVGAAAWKPDYQADLPTRLAAVVRDRARTRWIHTWMLVAMVVTPAGLAATAVVSGRPLVALAATAYVVGAVPWMLQLAFRITVQLDVAEWSAGGSPVPGWYEPVERWVGLGHRIHMLAGYTSAVPLAIGLRQVELIPLWLAWGGATWGVLWTTGLLLPRTRFAFEPPFWAHLFTFAVGVAFVL